MAPSNESPADMITQRLAFSCIAVCVAAVLFAHPARACFNWCAWWTWGRQSHPPVAAIDPTPLLEDANDFQLVHQPVIELQSAVPAYAPPVVAFQSDPFVEPYGMRESEIRDAFQTGYGHRSFASQDARDRAYKRWRDTIGTAKTTENRITYNYKSTTGDSIEVQIDRNTGTLFAKVNMKHDLGTNLNADRSLELFSRAYVATGGRRDVTNLVRKWRKGKADTANLEQLIGNDVSPLDIADGSSAGLIANRFYDMSASNYEVDDGVHKVTFRPNVVRDGPLE